MKVIEAQKILYEDIKNILESAGLKNGLGADKTGILFYPARKETTIPSGDTFLTYEIYYIQEAGRADEKAESQLGTIAVDVFTKKIEHHLKSWIYFLRLKMRQLRKAID